MIGSPAEGVGLNAANQLLRLTNPYYRLQLQVKGSLITPVTITTPTTLSVAEDGGTATYTVGLDEEPNNDVIVTVTADTGVTVNKSGGMPGPNPDPDLHGRHVG